MTTYGEIAKKVAVELGKKTMSSQAVGGAVGHNPISCLLYTSKSLTIVTLAFGVVIVSTLAIFFNTGQDVSELLSLIHI